MAINPSFKLSISLLLMHTLAAAVVYLTTMPLLASWVLLLLVVLSLTYCLVRDALLLLPNSWCEIGYAQGEFFVVTRDGSKHFGQLAGKNTVSPYFVILRVRLDGDFLAVSRVIFPDMLGKGVYRELCVLLKYS